MLKKRIFVFEKRYNYVHPVLTNYAASKDGEILNIKKQKTAIKIIELWISVNNSVGFES